ncbi:hypothetical protein AAEP93_006275 [Penicillium crustosum]
MARLICLSSSFNQRIRSKNILTASSLDLKKVQLILNLEHVVNDNELETVPPVPMPPQSLALSKVDCEISSCKTETRRTLALTLLSFSLLTMSFYLVSMMLSGYSASRLRQCGDTAL